MHWKNVLAVLLAILQFAPVLAGQDPARAVAQTLKIVPLEGNQAVNSTVSRTATAPVVEVRDLNDRPIENAEVIFELPESGPGGIFDKNSRVYKTFSDARGQATVAGYWPNDELGAFRIKITALSGGEVGTFYISQANSNRTMIETSESPRRSRRLWWILGGIGAAAAIGTVLAIRGDSRPTISLSPGSATIAGPR